MIQGSTELLMMKKSLMILQNFINCFCMLIRLTKGNGCLCNNTTELGSASKGRLVSPEHQDGGVVSDLADRWFIGRLAKNYLAMTYLKLRKPLMHY